LYGVFNDNAGINMITGIYLFVCYNDLQDINIYNQAETNSLIRINNIYDYIGFFFIINYEMHVFDSSSSIFQVLIQ
jgi:hypothetical protein